VIGLGVFYLALLFGTLPARPHVSWLLPLVWFVLSFKGIRQGPLFAITAAVTIADMWPHTIWHRLLVKHGDGSLARDPKPDEPAPEGGPWWVVPCAAVLFAFVLQVAQLRVPLIGADWVRLDPAMMPSDITPKVKEVLDHPGTRVFNDMNLGGYLIYHAPHAKIFMDDRCELYGDEWLRSYYDAMHATPETLGSIFEGWSERYRFEYAMIETTEPDKKLSAIERYLLSKPDKWVEVARGKSAILFERK